MLTSDLLVTRVSKGKIEPVYAQLDYENLEIASLVIDAFQRHVGKTYGELVEELRGLEEVNYRKIRGLAQILERRCIIDKDSVIDPVAARRAVFEESGGFVTCEDERREVLKRASGKLAIPMSRQIEPKDLEKALWADQEENLLVKEFQTLDPEDLLREYNLSLAQTLLFRATGMEIQIEEGYQPLFRKIKQLRLMYSITDDKIYLDGPLSMFKLTERYGTALAKLLPAIVRSPRWSLKASVLKKTPQGKRVYEFSLDHASKQILGREFEAEVMPSFDSAIEKEFYQLGFHGWTVRREPAVLKAGKYAFIPDFSLEKNGTRIYVEIVGFWTPEYLKNKIQKINQLEEKEKMILLVNRSLACSGSEFKTDNLLFYDRKIPHLEIIKILRKYEERQLVDEMAKLRSAEISLDGSLSVISLEEAAKRYGVSSEALKEAIKDQNKDRSKADYSLLGDQLVSNQILKTIDGELKGVKRHWDALQIFKRYGIKASSQALESLGYRVKWKGLDPEKAEILKA